MENKRETKRRSKRASSLQLSAQYSSRLGREIRVWGTLALLCFDSVTKNEMCVGEQRHRSQVSDASAGCCICALLTLLLLLFRFSDLGCECKRGYLSCMFFFFFLILVSFFLFLSPRIDAVLLFSYGFCCILLQVLMLLFPLSHCKIRGIVTVWIIGSWRCGDVVMETYLLLFLFFCVVLLFLVLLFCTWMLLLFLSCCWYCWGCC